MPNVGIFIIPVAITAVFFVSVFIYWGVKLAGISEATFGECIKVCIIILVVSGLVNLGVGVFVDHVPDVLSLLGGFVLVVLAIGGVFRAPAIKVVMATVYTYLLMLAAFIGGFALVGWFK